MKTRSGAQPVHFQAHIGAQAEEQVVELPPCAAALRLLDAAMLLDLAVVRFDAPTLVLQLVAPRAAAYLYGLTKNHGYVDGNKRIGFASAATFLRLNGQRLTASEVEAYDIVIGVVENRYSEGELATWIREHLEPIP